MCLGGEVGKGVGGIRGGDVGTEGVWYVWLAGDEIGGVVGGGHVLVGRCGRVVVGAPLVWGS